MKILELYILNKSRRKAIQIVSGQELVKMNYFYKVFSFCHSYIFNVENVKICSNQL